MHRPTDPAGDPELRLAATASGSRERRREAPAVPKHQSTSTPIKATPFNRVMSVIDSMWLRILDWIFNTSRWFPH